MKIKRSTVEKIFSDPNFLKVSEDYRNSCSNDILDGTINKAAYENLERAGLLTALAAYEGDKLIGFASIVMTEAFHHSKKIAVIETLWIDFYYRHTGAGLKILARCKQEAKAQGAYAIRASCPYNSPQVKVFERLFTPTDISFLKKL